MTDNEIIKALKYCTDGKDCDGCAYKYMYDCSVKMRLNIVDLINRQKAEIERLKGELEQGADIIEIMLEEKNQDISDLIFKERLNAIMEFAESLKQTAVQDYVLVQDIDELVKEMTGDDE